MHLSLYEQYYIRRLLRHYLSRLNYPTSGVAVCRYFQTDLSQLLKRLNCSDLHFTVQNLRVLIGFHQVTGENKFRWLDRVEIEQKILWLLGLKFLALVSNTQATVVSEASATRFNFVLDGQIHCGIRYLNELYGKCLMFGAEPNLVSFRTLFTLVNRRVPFVLTASEQQHIIWVDLRSPACPFFLRAADSGFQQAA